MGVCRQRCSLPYPPPPTTDQWCPTVVVDDYLNMLDELYAQVLTRHWDIEEEETTQSRRASRNLSVSTRGRTQGSMGSTGPDGLFGRGSMDQPSALTDMLEEEETPLFGDSVDAAFPFPSPGSVDPHASMVTHNSVLQSQQPSVPSSLEPSLVQESQQHSVLDPLPAYGHEQASLASEGGALVETAAPTRQRRKATAEVSGEGVAGGMADGSVELASASLQEGLPLTAAQRSPLFPHPPQFSPVRHVPCCVSVQECCRGSQGRLQGCGAREGGQSDG